MYDYTLVEFELYKKDNETTLKRLSVIDREIKYFLWLFETFWDFLSLFRISWDFLNGDHCDVRCHCDIRSHFDQTLNSPNKNFQTFRTVRETLTVNYSLRTQEEVFN